MFRRAIRSTRSARSVRSSRPARSARPVLATVACAVLVPAPAAAEYQPKTELLGGGGTAEPLKNALVIDRTDGGYRFRSGQQNSDIKITKVPGKWQIRYVDTLAGTKEIRYLPNSCKRQKRARGVAAVCTIPEKFRGHRRMYLEVWPRLGRDVVDGSTLPARFRLWVLGDKGNDVMRGGAGDDFFNGAQGRDKARGGGGDDWIRTGIENDKIWGGPGDDKLVGVDGNDVVRGGPGDDFVGGGNGADRLWANRGNDRVNCGGGRDNAVLDRTDRAHACESLTRR